MIFKTNLFLLESIGKRERGLVEFLEKTNILPMIICKRDQINFVKVKKFIFVIIDNPPITQYKVSLQRALQNEDNFLQCGIPIMRFSRIKKNDFNNLNY